MRLGRLAHVAVKTESELPSLALTRNAVSVRSFQEQELDRSVPRVLLLAAESPLSRLPEIDGGRHLILPQAERKACERAIEEAADLLSVANRRRRSLTSPIPCVALIPDNDAETDWLNESAGVVPGVLKSIAGNDYPPGIGIEHLVKLGDRVEGAQLLAEVHSQANALGKYRGLVRFFEAAFGRPFPKLAGKLAQLLSDGHLRYSKGEIDRWIGLRHGATHGDRKKTAELIFEADVWPYVGKMVEAAYDVLLNKSEWANSSRLRRDSWRPPAHVQEDGTMAIMEGQDIRILARLSDEFGAYPINFKEMRALPAGWWYRAAKSESGS